MGAVGANLCATTAASAGLFGGGFTGLALAWRALLAGLALLRLAVGWVAVGCRSAVGSGLYLTADWLAGLGCLGSTCGGAHRRGFGIGAAGARFLGAASRLSLSRYAYYEAKKT